LIQHLTWTLPGNRRSGSLYNTAGDNTKASECRERVTTGEIGGHTAADRMDGIATDGWQISVAGHLTPEEMWGVDEALLSVLGLG
jgi:hypothetical protein